MDLINFFSINHEVDDDDLRTVQLLGIRMFNDLAAGIRLFMSGYFQIGAMVQRDLLETIFLLDFLQTNLDQISIWRNANEAERFKTFGPAKIRIALDKRDGFTEKKREATYKLFCELAAHPSHNGFRMLSAKNGQICCGPFMEEPTLGALVVEHAKVAIQAAQVFTRFFRANKLPALRQKASFMKASGEWREHYFKVPFAKAEYEMICALIQRLEAKSSIVG